MEPSCFLSRPKVSLGVKRPNSVIKVNDQYYKSNVQFRKPCYGITPLAPYTRSTNDTRGNKILKNGTTPSPQIFIGTTVVSGFSSTHGAFVQDRFRTGKLEEK